MAQVHREIYSALFYEVIYRLLVNIDGLEPVAFTFYVTV